MNRTAHTLLLGCGGVGSCTLAMLGMLPDFSMSTLTIIDQSEAVESCASLCAARARGATFVRTSVTRDNWRALLEKYLHPGDTVIDLTFGISSIDVLEWCQHHQVCYINTAIERWEDELIPDNDAEIDEGEEKDWDTFHKELYDRTLYARHLEIAGKRFAANGPTAVLEHGCNPGLVSHFVRAALDDIVSSALQAVPNGSLSEELRKLHKSANYSRIAMVLGLRVIHISELDTQTTPKPKPEGTFVNTWSPMGFAEEALDWVQVGWGTHERPVRQMLAPSHGPRNQIFIPMHAMDTMLHSYVPNTPIRGMCIPHGEADTIAEHLTVYETSEDCSCRAKQNGGEPAKNQTKTTYHAENGSEPTKNHTIANCNGAQKAKHAIYRPSVYYVYQCAEVAMKSLDELRKRNYIPQTSYHVLTPQDVLKGEDRVGVLLMFENDPVQVLHPGTALKKPWSYWYGSILSNADNPLPDFNPTVVQVAASVVAAFKWTKAYPNKGICWPDSVPHKYILDLAVPFLGSVVSSQMNDYSPPHSLQFADFMCS